MLFNVEKMQKFLIESDLCANRHSFRSMNASSPFYSNDCVFSLMHLSMLSPRVRGGGGRGDPGEFDILMAARVKFPTPRRLLNANFPPLG